MKFSTKAATFLSSIKTQTYDKKESEMIITYQQKRVFHLSLLMLALCAPIYIYSVPFPNEQFYYINSVLFLFIIMCTLAYFRGLAQCPRKIFRGSLIPQQTFIVGSNAIQSASRGGMIVRYWAVRIRQNK